MPPAPGPTAASVLLLAVWIGLTAGFLDLGLLVIRKRLIEQDAIRLGEGFPWIIPAGVAALVLLPGFLLALLARLRRGRGSLGRAVWLLAFVGFLDLSTEDSPGVLVASSLLSAGLAVQSARLISAHRQAFLRFVRLTTPILAGAVLALALSDFGGPRPGRSARAIAALPPPQRSAPERPPDRLGYGPGPEPEPLRSQPPDDAQPPARSRARVRGSGMHVLDVVVAQLPSA